MAKSAKKRTKKAAKKRPAKKAAKRPAGRMAMMMATAGAGGGALGCCTITGLASRNKVFPNVTSARCQELADELGGNMHWYAGDCAK